MKSIQLADDVIPLDEFQAGAVRILKELGGRTSPLVVTQDGRPACVVISPTQFDRWRERQDFLESVARGLADVDAGLSIDDSELDAELDVELGAAHAVDDDSGSRLP
jgi:prevent-host-death family protein